MRKSAKKCSKRQVARLQRSSRGGRRWTTWPGRRREMTHPLAVCPTACFTTSHGSLQHQFSMFRRFFMRRRDRLTEPLAFSHLFGRLQLRAFFLRFSPLRFRLGFVASDAGVLARSLPPLKAKNSAEETSVVYWGKEEHVHH